MSTLSNNPLRQRMIEDMTARKLTAGTQTSHLRACRQFAAFLKRSPTLPTPRTSAGSNGIWPSRVSALQPATAP